MEAQSPQPRGGQAVDGSVGLSAAQPSAPVAMAPQAGEAAPRRELSGGDGSDE